MKNKKQSYHHGDLYQTLVATAKDILQDSGLESLSMRKLAERAGVSRTAPYHHFKDKHALLCAIAEDGFLRQDEMLQDVFQGDNEQKSAKKFERLVLAYLHFGTDNAQQYDLMYGGLIWKAGEITDSLDQVSKDSFKHWVTEVGKLQKEGVFKQKIDQLRLAQITWATLHGLCRLWNDGIYINVEKNIDQMAKTIVKLLLEKS